MKPAAAIIPKHDPSWQIGKYGPIRPKTTACHGFTLIAKAEPAASTLTEVRRAVWPAYEIPRVADPLRFQQGISGSLELFFRTCVRFQTRVQKVTGYPVPVFQRVAEFRRYLRDNARGAEDEELLAARDAPT